MDISNVVYYLIIFIFIVTFSRNLIYILSGPFYSLSKFKMLRGLRKYTKEDIEKILKISVVVPAHNEEVGVLNSVKSLLSSSYNNLEVILVDDGSIDKTSEAVNQFINNGLKEYLTKNKSFKFYRKENGGKGSALNFGIKKSSGDIIITMDADTIFDRNALSITARYFMNKELDAAVGNVKVGNANSFLGIIQQIEYILGFYFKRTHAIFNSEYIISGAFGIFRRNIFETYGYFDEKNKTEDIEFSTRLQTKGCKIAYIEDAQAYTETPSSFLSLMKQRLRWKKGRLDTFYKHRELFFSRNKLHNKFLSFYLLPTTLFYELELLVEPFLIIFVSVYLLLSHDFLMLVVWFIFMILMYSIALIFGSNNKRLNSLVILPFYFWLSYLIIFIEIYAMYASLKLIITKKEISWQNWRRKGLLPEYIQN
ncbi:MAG: hypothetical protein COU25_01475 [Candidatus Levybacteria bacterium CG10_big_fil_rev_8_21_14_0_10_35_13]|nr:MAG: hypothetical protein COU25_01475 [Candidatus Levybacteria bacterium CG10_big_fil_rev_8_21_14_0_10_35_13]